MSVVSIPEQTGVVTARDFLLVAPPIRVRERPQILLGEPVAVALPVRRWCTAWTMSLAVHLLLAACFAAIVISNWTAQEPELIAVWQAELPAAEQIELEPAVFDAAESLAGGSVFDSLLPVSQAIDDEDAVLADVGIDDLESAMEPSVTESVGSVSRPQRARKGRATSTGKGRGRGKAGFGLPGLGAGQGTGYGKPTFFGRPVEAKKIVYVVDCSGSMNMPHLSVAGTRFKRVQIELVQSILALTPEQEFYVIFFNSEGHSMPARELQPATPENKQQYLMWVAQQIAASGPTDPRTSIIDALKMEPDVIYFLTDGMFAPEICFDLTRLSQRQTAIHTFAFGGREVEPLFQLIAQQNAGQYTFVR
jgi:hypothetical protein